jgi:hypothetical protein
MRRHFVKLISSVLVTSLLAGCATSQEGFRRNKYNLSDATLCRTAYKARDAQWDFDVKEEIAAEMIRRGLDGPKCQPIMRKDTADTAKEVLGAVALITLAVVAARAAGGIPCNDGTVSHSQHRQGACSHHGGIR